MRILAAFLVCLVFTGCNSGSRLVDWESVESDDGQSRLMLCWNTKKTRYDQQWKFDRLILQEKKGTSWKTKKTIVTVTQNLADADAWVYHLHSFDPATNKAIVRIMTVVEHELGKSGKWRWVRLNLESLAFEEMPETEGKVFLENIGPNYWQNPNRIQKHPRFY